MDLFKQEDEEIKKFKELRKKEEEEFAMRAADKLKLPYVNLLTQTIDTNALGLIEEEVARNAEIAIIAKIRKNLKICVKNPQNPKTISVLEGLKEQGFTTDMFLVSLQSLKKAWESYALITKKEASITGEIEITPENLWKLKEQIKFIDDFKQMFEGAKQKSTSMVLELIIAGSLSLGSSDVHIEPEENRARIRFRIDGILQEATEVTQAIYKHLLNRIKLLSELKINVSDIPQDGRLTIATDEYAIEIRTSILPGPNGESIVLRILDPSALSVSIEDLGLLSHDMKIMEEELKKPYGLIVVTGPTGSGKTTTLYSFIKLLNSTEVKIITIEDPIEYHIEGISQSQVDMDSGYTFASGLRSILRQDPDVILVGEMRDLETADIGMHAALTGHLVLSTLHTNDAPSSIIRLIDMKISPSILAPAINVIIAQRLVRKVCEKCSVKEKLSPTEFTMIKDAFTDIPKRANIPEFSENTEIIRAKGCQDCNNTGYKGRVGIFELFQVNAKVEDMIVSKPTLTMLFKVAKEGGMVSMKQDGFLKVLAGVTTLDEIDRVTK